MSGFFTVNKQSGRQRLFCFPHAGGGSAAFYPWARFLAPETEVVPVQLAGRENRLKEPPVNSIGPLIQQLAGAMEPWLDKPFALYGHSMGALISFELARELRRRRAVSPICIFASAFRAPHLPDKHAPIHLFPDAEFVRELLRRYEGIPAAVLQDPELMQLYLPVLRADLAMLETYRYTVEEALDCPISAGGGLSDRGVDRAELEAWRAHTRGRFKLRMFEGNHFFLNPSRDPVLRSIADDLRES